MTAEELVRRDAAAFFHQDGSSPCLSALRSVGGIWLEDLDGRRLIDFHGNTAHHIGHAHPRLVAALKAQLDALPFCPRRYTNEPAVELAELLQRRWPGGDAVRVLFATGGSDAVEIALKLARVATGAHETISLEGSYHGDGLGALGLKSARLDPRLGPLLPGRHHVTPYWQDAGRMLDDMRAAFATSSHGIAAVVAEPIRSSCHVPPPGLWQDVRALCDAHGAMLIFDEIPSGLCKTGRFFAFEHFGAVPDAVVLGKALGGGVVPIAAVVARAGLDVAPELRLGHYTHEKNPLTCRAALETLRIIEDEKLVEHAAAMGPVLSRQFAPHGVDAPRGLGLLQALPVGSAERAEALAAAAYQAGLSTTTKPGGALGLSPPLTITPEELQLAAGMLQMAQEQV